MGWSNIAAPPTDRNPQVERVSLASAGPALYTALFEAGERLLAALNEEHRRSKLYPKDITQVVAYLEQVSFLRQRVNECAIEYCACLTQCRLPKVAASEVIERGRKDGAAGLAMLAPAG